MKIKLSKRIVTKKENKYIITGYSGATIYPSYSSLKEIEIYINENVDDLGTFYCKDDLIKIRMLSNNKLYSLLNGL